MAVGRLANSHAFGLSTSLAAEQRLQCGNATAGSVSKSADQEANGRIISKMHETWLLEHIHRRLCDVHINLMHHQLIPASASIVQRPDFDISVVAGADNDLFQLVPPVFVETRCPCGMIDFKHIMSVLEGGDDNPLSS